MSAWPGKYVIGLTGNIATGKSVVRKMLEHLGAYGIDADALSHRAISKGAPGYGSVVETFGKWILDADGQIDRGKLGKLAFANPDAMEALEAIIHPLVRVAVNVLVRQSNHKVIVLEAIKLLDGDLHNACDSIWVADCSQEEQARRLVHKRSLPIAVAQQRISAQSPQEAKRRKAHVVIDNSGSFENTWKQVVEEWRALIPAKIVPPPEPKVKRGNLEVYKAGPKEAGVIASFINHVTLGYRQVSQDEIMADFGEKAFLLLELDKKVSGLMGWQVENLVSRVDDVLLEEKAPVSDSLKIMLSEIEDSSKELQCEALLLFLKPRLAQHEMVLKSLGYTTRTIRSLSVRAWQDAAVESMPNGTVMFFKQLREDRVLRPV